MMQGKWGRIVLWVVLGGAILASAMQTLGDVLWSPVPRPQQWVLYLSAGGVALMALVALGVTVTRRWPYVAARRRFKTTPTDNRHLVAFTIYYVALILPFVVDGPAAVGKAWYLLCNLGAPVALVWMWRCGSFRTTLCRDWGLHLGRGFFVEAGWGLIAYAACWCLWRTLGFGLTGSAAFNPWWRQPTLLFLMLLYAPIVEEALFRGALYRELRRSLRWFGAAFVVAVAFTVIHGSFGTWSMFSMLFVHGIILCLLREWRDSLVAPMVTHLAWNGVPTLLELLGSPAY
jgi:membrane protease YdiL (CAAX protease family)